jgi:predicted phage baseplate assembly protein
VRFGDGVSGAPPQGTIAITYKTGGGIAGNVDADRLVVLEGGFKDAFGTAVQVSARNAQPASGGTDRESVAAAKLLAPESLRALTRTVAREDFEINARKLPGVARALMLTSNEDASIAENTGILYVIPQANAAGAMPTPALKNLVLKQVTEVFPCTLTFQVSVQDPVYRTLDIVARLFLRQGFARGDVRDRVRANLAATFRVSEPDGTPNPLVDFGFNLKDAEGNPSGEVAWSDVFNVIRDTVGVRKIGDARLDLTLNGLPSDVKLKVREFPVLGNVKLVDGDTGELL